MSRASVRRLLRDGTGRIWAFPSAKGVIFSRSGTERETGEAQLCSPPVMHHDVTRVKNMMNVTRSFAVVLKTCRTAGHLITTGY